MDIHRPNGTNVIELNSFFFCNGQILEHLHLEVFECSINLNI